MTCQVASAPPISSSLSPSLPPSAAECLARGLQLGKAGAYPSALTWLEQACDRACTGESGCYPAAIATAPESRAAVKARAAMGLAWLSAGQVERAIETFETALRSARALGDGALESVTAQGLAIAREAVRLYR